MPRPPWWKSEDDWNQVQVMWRKSKARPANAKQIAAGESVDDAEGQSDEDGSSKTKADGVADSNDEDDEGGEDDREAGRAMSPKSSTKSTGRVLRSSAKKAEDESSKTKAGEDEDDEDSQNEREVRQKPPKPSTRSTRRVTRSSAKTAGTEAADDVEMEASSDVETSPRGKRKQKRSGTGRGRGKEEREGEKESDQDGAPGKGRIGGAGRGRGKEKERAEKGKGKKGENQRAKGGAPVKERSGGARRATNSGQAVNPVRDSEAMEQSGEVGGASVDDSMEEPQSKRARLEMSCPGKGAGDSGQVSETPAPSIVPVPSSPSCSTPLAIPPESQGALLPSDTPQALKPPYTQVRPSVSSKVSKTVTKPEWSSNFRRRRGEKTIIPSTLPRTSSWTALET